MTDRDAGERAARDRRQKERANPAWASEPNSPRALAVALLSVGGSMLAVLLVVVVLMSGALEDLLEPPPPAPATPIGGLAPPAATPLASPPAEPAGDGTEAVISTEAGDIRIALFTESAPVAAQNFINLADAGFYDGVVFHRIIPGFMIQGGDPEGTGRGGPPYTIPDEPVVGEYERGTVAMARTDAPNSAGSQFFIVVEDSPHLAGGGYVIFGRVVEGMEVADEIVAGPRTGPNDDLAADPVAIETVTIVRPE